MSFVYYTSASGAIGLHVLHYISQSQSPLVRFEFITLEGPYGDLSQRELRS